MTIQGITGKILTDRARDIRLKSYFHCFLYSDGWGKHSLARKLSGESLSNDLKATVHQFILPIKSYFIRIFYFVRPWVLRYVWFWNLNTKTVKRWSKNVHLFMWNSQCLTWSRTTPIQTSSGLIPVPPNNTFQGLLQYELLRDEAGIWNIIID